MTDSSVGTDKFANRRGFIRKITSAIAVGGASTLLFGNVRQVAANPGGEISGSGTSGQVAYWVNASQVAGFPSVLDGGGNNIAFGLSGHATGRNSTVGGGLINTASASGATVAGGAWNSAAGVTATVGGGYFNRGFNDFATVAGGYSNSATSQYATVGGGQNNVASGQVSTVAGGSFNSAVGLYSTVGGGYTNKAAGQSATVGGGLSNSVSGNYATIAGGNWNSAAGQYATVGGGTSGAATGDSSTVGGGSRNISSASGATVGGGQSNSAANICATVGGGLFNSAQGYFATVPGGAGNAAGGDSSFAAGTYANIQSAHHGTILFSDDTYATSGVLFKSASADEFAVRATGGARFVTAVDTSGNTLTQMTVNASGSLGVKNTAPAFDVHVIGTTDPASVTVDGIGIVGPNFQFRRARGTAASPSALLSGDGILFLVGKGYGATGFSGGGRANVSMYAAENWTDTHQGTYMIFKTTQAGTTTQTEKMRITDTGNVGIGTASPKSSLHVVGLPVFANNDAAITGGLTAGAFYRTGADPDPVCVVH